MTRPSDPLSLDEEEARRLLDSWNPERSTAPVPGPPASAHARLEVAHAVREGHRPGDPPPLVKGDPVPGCPCTRCVLLTRGASLPEVDWAKVAIRDLARVDPTNRLKAARKMSQAAEGLDLPFAGWLCRRAAEVSQTPDAEPPEPREEDLIPVEEARNASIVDVARRLGLGDLKPCGREYVVRCPFHDDRDPSLRLKPDRGRWYCLVCGLSGDGIDLVMTTRDLPFPAAVKWMAGGGR